MSFKSQYLASLDGVRGFAVLFVVSHHLFFGISDGIIHLPQQISAIPVSGVDLFFVLSGFLIGGIIIDEYKSINFWKKFMLRRMGRIFPVYFLVVGSFAIAMLFLQHKYFFDTFLLVDPLPIAPYFTFTQSYFQGMANVSGPKWVAMTWSLSVEEQFYLFLPFIAILFGRKGIFSTIIIAILAAPVIRNIAFDHLGFYAGYMFFPARMDSIAMGVAVAIIVRNNKLFSHLVGSKLVYLIPFTLFFFLNLKINLGGYILDSFTFRALFYASIIMIVSTKNNIFIRTIFENKIVLFFGSISFALYMYHQLISGLLYGIIYNRAPKIDNLESFFISILVFLISIILSMISLKYFETPIRNYVKHKSNKLSGKS